MKRLSLFIIALVIAFYGQLCAERLKKRYEKLSKICMLISCINTRISFSSDSAEDIFSFLCNSGEYKTLGFVSDCSRLMSEGNGFREAWNKALCNSENTESLKKEDIGLLYSFGAGFGVSDCEGQKANCELYMKLLEEKRVAAQKNIISYSKPFRGIGILLGAAVYIIFI